MIVAVVIPVWDAYVRWLPEAVASVRQQEESCAIIVVDNASDDPVPELEGTSVVRSAQRLTTGAARNLGLAAVDAPLVVFLDADDLMLPGALRALTRGIDSHPEAKAFVMAIIDGDTGRRHRSPRRVAGALASAPRCFALANTVWSLLPTQGATIMRTADVRACGGYADRAHGEDWALGASLAWRGPIRFDATPALVYRWRWDSPGRDGSAATLTADARCVRRRLRADPLAPAAVRRATPLIAVLQWVAVVVARPLFRGLRQLRRSARAPRRAAARRSRPRRDRSR